MSRTLILMLGVWAVGSVPARAADKPATLPMPQAAASSTPLSDMGSSSACCSRKCRAPRVRSCLSKLSGWLCYRAPEPCPKEDCCVACCRPPLYTFFLHHCQTCADDSQDGIPITFNYNSLLEENGDCHRTYGGCRGCK